MTSHSDAERVFDLAEKIGACMLTTKTGEGLRARPMHAKFDREGGTISFLADARAHKDDEIAADRQVCLAFAKPGSNTYVSISGAAKVTADRGAIDAQWTEMSKIWFPDGPGDPNIRVLTVTPRAAEFWDDSSNPIAVAFELAKARVKQERPDLGENRKVAMGGGR